MLKLHEVKDEVLPRLLGDQVLTDVRLGRKRAAIFDVEFFQLHDTQEVMVYEMSLVDESTGDVLFHTYVNPTITVNGEVFYSGLNGVSVGTKLKKFAVSLNFLMIMVCTKRVVFSPGEQELQSSTNAM